jgi:RES domain-containing protein
VSGLTVWRLVRRTHAADAFSGEGARRFPGRWNPRGLPVVCCAESRALAALEVLVNVQDAAALAGREWVVIPAVIPEDCIDRPHRVADDWQANPAPAGTQQFGARWAAAARTAVLRVPSVVVHGEFNFVLNPAHPDFARIRILPAEPFRFDPRLG